MGKAKDVRVEPKPSESDLARGFVIQVTLMNGEPYAFNLHDVTWVELEDLSGEVAGQAQRYAFYAMLQVGVRDALRTARGELAAFVAGVSEAVRDELGPKATETHVRQVTAARPGYAELQAKIDRLERLEDRFAVVREALTQRRDMLQSACMIRAPERGGRSDDRVRYSVR